MWTLLYSLRQQGWHFRRQVQIGRYYADFVCHGSLLVIEVDGETHGQAASIHADAVRDNYMHGRGFLVLRFSNYEVTHHLEGVFATIANHLTGVAGIGATPTPDPSPQGGGRGQGGAIP